MPADRTPPPLQTDAPDLAQTRHATMVRSLVVSLEAAPGAPRVELIETHISTLLLAGDTVYKLRKPLDLGFLDFRTIAARRHDAVEELRINRRTAPALYLGLRAVCGPVDAAHFGGDALAADAADAATVIDWAVQMRRFDTDATFDRLAERGQLDAARIDALARTVADFHARLAPSALDLDASALAGRFARDNLAALAAWAAAEGGELWQRRIARLAAWSEAGFARLAPRLVERQRRGRVREAHGDLHLANIVWHDGVPRLFDALEFNPALRHIDVLDDVAFTFMDLHDHGLPESAWRFINGWFEATGDYDGAPLLAWFAAYRALVRARVALLRAGQAGVDEAARAAARQTAQRRLNLAERFAGLSGAPPAPLVLLTTGVSGSGKSTVAQALAEMLGAVRVRSDVERKRLHGLAPHERPTDAATLYHHAATVRTYARLAEIGRDLVQGGVSVVLDAAFLLRDERRAVRAWAEAAHARFAIVACEADEVELRRRIARRMAADDDPSDATPEVLAMQLAVRELPGADERSFLHTLHTTGARTRLRERCRVLARTLAGPIALGTD